jgi:hypothetical protein
MKQHLLELLLDAAYWCFVPILLCLWLAYRIADRVSIFCGDHDHGHHDQDR